MEQGKKISQRKARKIVSEAFEFLTTLNIKFIEFVGRQAALGFETNAVADKVAFYEKQWKEYIHKRNLADNFLPMFSNEAEKIVNKFIEKKKELENEKEA